MNKGRQFSEKVAKAEAWIDKITLDRIFVLSDKSPNVVYFKG